MTALAVTSETTPAGRNAAGRLSLLVFSDDWGRHPSSCQHLVSRLLPKHEVTWVNTIGMRPPTIGWSTLVRASEKCRQWFVPGNGQHPRTNKPHPHVLNPRMWPWFKRRHDRWLNCRLLRRQLAGALRDDHPTVAVTTIPTVADVMQSLPVDAWVYYCVDDFGQWPGLDRRTMAAMEEKVIERADCCIAASRVLQQRLMQFRPDVELLTHGVDLEHWRSPSAAEPLAKDPVQGPTALFWGLIDKRLDVSFLGALNERLQGRVLLVGPQDSPDPAWQSLPRVECLPAVEYERLPAIGNSSDVLVMPYVDAPVTRAMQPLKLLEYLATGKPVVARDLPATRPWGDCLDLAETPEQFAALVIERIESGLPEDQRLARQRLVREDWNSKAVDFERMLLAQCEATNACAETAR